MRTTQLFPTTGGEWISNDPSIATVENTSLVTAHGIEEVTFYFIDSAIGWWCETDLVRVKSPPPSNIKHLAGLDSDT